VCLHIIIITIIIYWKLLEITQKIPEQHKGKVRYQGTTESSEIGNCARTTESADVEVRNIQHGK